MNNIQFFANMILCLAFLAPLRAQPLARIEKPTSVDTVIYYPGFFNWDINTVIKIRNGQASDILRYQEILNHSNTDFSEQPNSLILIDIDFAMADSPDVTGHPSYSITISEDTVHLTASSKEAVATALARLHSIKMRAEKNSPDYGLIYLRCGLYRVENF